MKKTETMAPRINPQRVPRERRIDHNTVSRPRRVNGRPATGAPPETVEQFEARGGQEQRLTASWEQAA